MLEGKTKAKSIKPLTNGPSVCCYKMSHSFGNPVDIIKICLIRTLQKRINICLINTTCMVTSTVPNFSDFSQKQSLY